MAKNRNKVESILQILKGYIKLLEKNNFPIDKAILFGSYANGKYDEWSDIDVLLVSKAFSGERFLDKERIRRLTISYNSNISPIPFNSKDFDVTNLFIKDVVDNGVVIS